MAFGDLLDSASARIGNGASDMELTLPGGAPAAGDLIVVAFAIRTPTGAVVPLVPATGWTAMASMDGGESQMLYRVAAGTEPATMTWEGQGDYRAWIGRFDGPWDASPLVDEVTDIGTTAAASVSVESTDGRSTLFLAQAHHPTWFGTGATPGDDMTELDDGGVGPVEQDPGMWVGSRVVQDAAGAYTLAVTLGAAGFFAWHMRGLAFVGGDPASESPVEPYVPPEPARAILEIYVSDPEGPRWDEALWDTGEWGSAGWESITPWSIIADVSWGADRAEAGILHDQVPGTWVVETHDPDRVLDPANPESPFQGELVAGLPIRLLHHSRIIRQGECTRIWYSHADRGGRINATDGVSKLANARVPEGTVLSDTLRLRSIEAIAEAGADIIAWPPIAGGDPALASVTVDSEVSAWSIIADAAREVLHIPWVNNGNRLTFRPWDAPLERGRVIASPMLIDLATWTSSEGLFSVVRAQEPGGAMEERAATPTPSYGKRVHERTQDTINAGDWAARVLADRRDGSLRYVPGDIYPLTDADVAWLARLEIMEDVILSFPQADPPVFVTARILGMNVRAVDETKDPAIVRTRWRWRLITTVVATAPLTDDSGTEYLYSDQTPTELLYPDGA